MKAPISWLQDFVKIDIPAEALADKLVHAGFEVEDIIRESDNIRNVVTGRVIATERHPNSDHLWICQVNVKTATLQIVTGAQNVKVNDIVPVALDGAQLPDGKRIYNGELRGVKSLGMLCGGSELGLTDDDYEGASVDGIMIMKPDTKVGVDINEVLGRTDVILDVSVTANRPDCNSILGIAREIGAVLHKPVKMPITSYTATPERIFNMLDVQVEDGDLCPRYMAKAVKNIKITQSPKIMQDRLRAVGIKPINNIVDITNYILIELGQPMHAFDYEKIAGKRLVVRRATEGETITTLDNTSHALESDMLVIADAEKPLAVAGIMGGLDSGISDNTNTIIFESAKFARDNIRRTSRKLNLKSDSSARFEKGIDFLSQAIAIDRALTLIQINGWGTIVSGTIDTNMNAVKPRTITVPYKKINSVLGIKVPTDKMVSILNSLQIKTVVKGKKLECNIPAFREDIEDVNDLAEEIIRLYGYNKIKSTLFADARQTMGGREVNRSREDLLKRILTAKGADEIITYSFISPKTFDLLRLDKNDELRRAVPIMNPLGEDVSIMRTTLVGSMLSIIGGNYSKNNKEGVFFETSKVFRPKTLPLTDFPVETETLSVGMYGGDCDFYSLKGLLDSVFQAFKIDKTEYRRVKINYLHEGRSAEIFVEGESVGYLGEVYPDVSEAYGIDARVYIAEINLEKLFSFAKDHREFKALPKYPAISRDLALLVKDGVSSDQVVAVIRKVTNRKLLESVEIFDVYKGQGVPKGNTSIALTVVFRAPDRTLTDDEVQAEIDHALKSMKRKYRVKLRV